MLSVSTHHSLGCKFAAVIDCVRDKSDMSNACDNNGGRTAPVGDNLVDTEGIVADMRTQNRLLPPRGRKYHPIVAQFAQDGRYLLTRRRLIDTLTEKDVPYDWRPEAYLPGTGFIAAHL